jgi:23S rRNA pseudouridine2605 synthase
MNDAMVRRHTQSCPALCRASTSLYTAVKVVVDGRDKPGHDEMDEKSASHKAGERIAKAIARAGLASRREAEAWIAAGRIAVNGEVIRSPAFDVTAHDRVSVDGELLPAKERTRLFLYHKRRRLLTTRSDPQGRPTIFAALPKNLPRLISIGRLDFNTEGLLLLTNDGALARVLELPATGWLRRYRVRAHGSVTQQQLDSLRQGVSVDGIHYGAIDATLDRVQGSNLWLTFAIREGKNREVRNVLSQLGLRVTRLIRVSFGPFRLGDLDEGEIEEVRTRVLRQQLGARLVALSGADFSTPIAPSSAASKLDDLRESKSQSLRSHSWRAPSDESQRPLRRKFHGSRRDADRSREQPAGEVRPEALTDRKGRKIEVERHGHAGPAERPKEQQRFDSAKRGHRSRFGRRAWPDRAGGPRPSRPRSPQ